MGGKVVFLLSGNIHKFREARLALKEYGLSTALLRRKTFEIQSDSIEEVALVSALYSAKKVRLPVLVEDAGLFIEGLSGFPGVYSSYVLRTIGNEGVLKLMEGLKDRRATFRSAVVFCDENMKPKIFNGEVRGVILEEKRGTEGFGFDPIFAPEEGEGRSFAEMSIEEKSELSHRGKAFRAFGEWYTSTYKV